MNSGSARRQYVRAPGLISRAVGDEFVVIDPSVDRAHSLSGGVADLWKRVENRDAPIASSEGDSQQLIELGLLVEETGLSRRSLLTRSGLVVAGAGVASIVLPEAVAAASTGKSQQFVGGTDPAAGTIVIPKGSRALKVIIAGGGGAQGASNAGVPGSGGLVTWDLGSNVVLTEALSIAYVLGRLASGGTGGSGSQSGGSSIATPATGKNPIVGGGGGGSTRVTFTTTGSSITGSMVAGGGGGSGSGTNATNQAGGNGGVTGATAGGSGLPGGGGGAGGSGGVSSSTEGVGGSVSSTLKFVGGAGGAGSGPGSAGTSDNAASGGGGAGASRSSVTTSLAVTGQPTPTATGSAAAEGYITITWIEP